MVCRRRVLGNSMNRRAEIQYALAQTRWLAMEGARCQTIGDLCEDTVFIARKLGYDWCISGWKTTNGRGASGPSTETSFTFSGTSCPAIATVSSSWAWPARRSKETRNSAGKGPAKILRVLPEDGERHLTRRHRRIRLQRLQPFERTAGGGWAKAIAAWEKQNQLPVRFDGCLTPPPEKQPEKIPALQTATT